MTRRPLTPEEAETLLPDKEVVHCFYAKDLEGSRLTQSSLPREMLMERFREKGVELSGPEMRSLHHGLVSGSKASGWLFIETRRTK